MELKEIVNKRNDLIEKLNSWRKSVRYDALCKIARSIRDDKVDLSEVTVSDLTIVLKRIARGNGEYNGAEDQFRALEALAESGSEEALDYLRGLRHFGEFIHDDIGYQKLTPPYFTVPGKLGELLHVKTTHVVDHGQLSMSKRERAVTPDSRRGRKYHQRMIDVYRRVKLI